MKKSDWVLLFIVLSAFVVGIIYYPQLPDKMPIHWNIQGEVDNYSDKLTGTFLMPIINVGMFLLFIFLPKIDPRRENYEKFQGVYHIFRWTLHIFFTVLFFITIYHSLNIGKTTPWYLDVSFIAPVFVSILFIIMGNYFGKIKDNFFIGIRTPWTLSSHEVWYKTHRLASKLYVLSGLLGIIGAILGLIFSKMVSFVLLIVPLLLFSVYLVLYSYLEFLKEKKNNKE